MTPAYIFLVPLIIGMTLAFVVSAIFVAVMKWLDGKDARRQLNDERRKLLQDLRFSRNETADIRKQLRPLQNACEAARYHIQSVPKRYGNPDDSAILNELDAVLATREQRTASNYVRQFEQPTQDDFQNLKTDLKTKMKRVMQGGEHEPA